MTAVDEQKIVGAFVPASVKNDLKMLAFVRGESVSETIRQSIAEMIRRELNPLLSEARG